MDYWSDSDEYCYPGTEILRNKLGLKDQQLLDDFEAVSTEDRISDLQPIKEISPQNLTHIHFTLFQDIYDWAGEFSRCRISKGGTVFCYPENIHSELDKLFARLATENYLKDYERKAFLERLAFYMGELNAIHPFRDGNGRTSYLFFASLLDSIGYRLNLTTLLADRTSLLKAIINSYNGDYDALIALLYSSVDMSPEL